MNKVFLYLYPIKEFSSLFLYHSDRSYDELCIEQPFDVLNQCIDKRYRENGYQVVFVLYPDKKMYGIKKYDSDKVIYADVPFSEATFSREKSEIGNNFVPRYPDENQIIAKLGVVDEIVVGGFHAQDCVKRLAEKARDLGIKSLVDLDLTDLFFYLYKQDCYFVKESYSPLRLKDFIINRNGSCNRELYESLFKRNYSSSVYGFYEENLQHKIK